MAQGTYIGQAQINMQTTSENDNYKVGDVVVWKSTGIGRYLVEGFEDNKVILSPIGKHVWRPNQEWFVKEELPELEEESIKPS